MPNENPEYDDTNADLVGHPLAGQGFRLDKVFPDTKGPENQMLVPMPAMPVYEAVQAVMKETEEV